MSFPNKISANFSKQNAVDALNNRGVLTDAGAAWLKLALDPFHDDTVSISGMPDADAGDSIVQFFKRKVTITKPNNLPAGKWDCHICTLPVMNRPSNPSEIGAGEVNGLVAGVRPSSTFVPQPAVNLIDLGTVCVNSVASDSESWPGEKFIAGGTFHQFNQDIDSKAYAAEEASVSPMSKLIGGGFEVHNDTEMLHKGGSVVMYCMPQSSYDNLVVRESDNPNFVAATNEAVTIRQPPSTVGEAQLFPNSRTLSAKDGCYVPFYIDTHDTKFECHTSKILRTRRTESADILLPPGQGDVSNDAGVTAASEVYDNLSLGVNNLKKASIETCGAYFTGLSEETVLTLTLRFVVESRPTSANPQLLSLASQTALYDPLALELYRYIRANLPVGVPVSFNAKGDWFKMAMKHVGAALITAAPVVSLLGPEFGAIAVAAGTAATALSKTNAKKSVPPRPTAVTRKSVPGTRTLASQQRAPRRS